MAATRRIRPALSPGLVGLSALLVAASAAVTIAWSGSMSAMSRMPMPGRWALSMLWTRMPGQSWAGLAAAFLGMWVVMMVAMMLPSLVPMLGCYRDALVSAGAARVGRLTALVGVGYFSVWAGFGLAAFALGVALVAVELRHPALARAAPLGAGVVVLLAGGLQFTGWKARHLAYCRAAPARAGVLPARAASAWRHGARFGLHCSRCCVGLMATLLVVGIMDLRAMALVAAAITLERLASAGERAARAIGVVMVGGAVALIGQAATPVLGGWPTAGAVDSPGKLYVSADSAQVLRVHVAAPRAAVVGVGVPIKLVVTNTGTARVDVLQAAPEPDFDLVIAEARGRIVWQRLPPDAVLTTAGLHYRLAPGESHDLETIVWNQRDLRGRRVGPGHYKVYGTFYGGIMYLNRSDIPTDTVSLLIER